MPKVLNSSGQLKVTTTTSVMPPAGSIYGFNLKYLSTTSISVAPGQALDNKQIQNISLLSTQTISTGTLSAINGLDQTAISGTVATSTANATVTGTGTSFLTAFGVRTGTGTYSTSSTTVTGTGTKFLSELAVNDLIGDPVNGFARVTAVNSDTSATLAVALPNGSPPGISFQVIENAHLQVNSQTVRQINSITSNTTLTLSANSSATVASGGTCYIGALPSVQTYLMVWIATGGSGTGVYLSTQRTTPFGISGYTTAIRRVGSVIWTGTAIIQFKQTGKGIDRWYQFPLQAVVNGSTATSYTAVICSSFAPPTAGNLLILATIYNPSTLTAIEIASRDLITIGGTGNGQISFTVATNGYGSVQASLDCDGAQVIAYYLTIAVTNTPVYIYVSGYQDSL